MPTSAPPESGYVGHLRPSTGQPPGPPEIPFDPDDWNNGRGDDSRDDDPEPVVWVTLATFLHPAEAHIARLRLESAGITCVLLDELTAGTHCLSLAVGGVKLQVPAYEGARGAELLRRMRRDAVETNEAVVARFAIARHATRAACVVEAAGIDCECRNEHRGAALRVDPAQAPQAAAALARSPFAAALTPVGVMALARRICPGCGEHDSRPDYLHVRSRLAMDAGDTPPLGPWHRRLLVRLLAARHCRRCQQRF